MLSVYNTVCDYNHCFFTFIKYNCYRCRGGVLDRDGEVKAADENPPLLFLANMFSNVEKQHVASRR